MPHDDIGPTVGPDPEDPAIFLWFFQIFKGRLRELGDKIEKSASNIFWHFLMRFQRYIICAIWSFRVEKVFFHLPSPIPLRILLLNFENFFSIFSPFIVVIYVKRCIKWLLMCSDPTYHMTSLGKIIEFYVIFLCFFTTFHVVVSCYKCRFSDKKQCGRVVGC